MKKICVAIIIAALLMCTPIILVANNNITVIVNGREVNFPDQTPIIVENQTLVPVRGVFEALGWDAVWQPDTQTALLSRGHTNISIQVGEPTFSVFVYTPGSPFPGHAAIGVLDVPAQIIGDRVMLPLRAVLESVGYNLNWDEVTRTVIISAPTISQSFTIQEYYGITAMALEFIYECDLYRYYLSSIRSSLITVTFHDGTSMSLREVLALQKVTIGDLIYNGLNVIKMPQHNR